MCLFFGIDGATALTIGMRPAAKGPIRSDVLQFFYDRWYT